MNQDVFGRAARAILTARVPERANQLLLLGVDRDHRLSGGLELLGAAIDVFELGVAIHMLGARAGLAIGLQAVAKLAQQHRNGLVAHPMAAFAERRRQVTQALRGPQQRPLRIAACRRLDQRRQVIDQACIALAELAPPAADAAHPTRAAIATALDLGDATIDRRARKTGGRGDRRHPTVTRRHRLRGRQQPTTTLRQRRANRLITSRYSVLIDHTYKIYEIPALENPQRSNAQLIHLFSEEPLAPPITAGERRSASACPRRATGMWIAWPRARRRSKGLSENK